MGNRRPRTRRCAFTLLELMVTLSIAAGLLLVGIGVYYRMNRGFAVRGAVTHLESALRGARIFAVHNRSRVTVLLRGTLADEDDTDAEYIVETVTARGRQTVSCWHFEFDQFSGSELLGALDQKAAITGSASHDEDGRIGGALKLNGTDQYLSVDDARLHGIRSGVFVEAYVRPDATGLGDGDSLPIVSKGSAFSLALEYEAGRFKLVGSVETADAPVEDETLASIVPDEWTHVGLAFQRDVDGIVLTINGRELDLIQPAGAVVDRTIVMNADPLLIGSDGTSHFHGSLDELQIASLVTEEARRLMRGANVTVLSDLESEDAGTGKAATRTWRIHFDDEGKLTGIPVSIYVGSKTDDLHRLVTIGRLGNVEVRRVNGRPEEED